MTQAELQSFQQALAAALAANPDVRQFGQGNSVGDIFNAYVTGDWSGVTSLTGKPFSDSEQAAAVAEARRVLGPAYEAQKTKDTADVTDTLGKDARDFGTFQEGEKQNFIADKNTLDKDAADNGILFSGARNQKLNDLRTSYADREAQQRQSVADAIRSTGRSYQYTYGDDAAKGLSSMYKLPGATTFDPYKPGGGVRASSALSSYYQPGQYNFQGTAPVAQEANVQTRAATQLANRANKLSLAGYGTKF